MTSKIPIKIKKLHPDAKLPCYAHEGDAGLDLFSTEDKIILPKERALISTGISVEMPEGFVALVWDKSGLAAKSGITTLAGVIEYTYRGEYKIALLNTSDQEHIIKKGDKIAQLLIQPIATADIQETTELSETQRGDGAFGSTGIS